MRSMTGYGIHRSSSAGVSLEIEIRSWNHKGFDVQFRIPDSYSFLELSLRDRLARAALRGKVSCAVRLRGEIPGREVRYHEALITGVLAPFKRLAETAGVAPQVTLSDLIEIPGALEVTENPSDAISERIRAGFDEALAAWDATRVTEGARMSEAIREQAEALKSAAARIEARCGTAVLEQKQKIRARIVELLEGAAAERDEKRIEMEAALLAEKGDIKEEQVRLKALLARLERLARPAAAGPAVQVGPEVQFVLQELLRETNTTGSKSQDLEIIQSVIEAKTAIDRMKELSANVV